MVNKGTQCYVSMPGPHALVWVLRTCSVFCFNIYIYIYIFLGGGSTKICVEFIRYEIQNAEYVCFLF